MGRRRQQSREVKGGQTGNPVWSRVDNSVSTGHSLQAQGRSACTLLLEKSPETQAEEWGRDKERGGERQAKHEGDRIE